MAHVFRIARSQYIHDLSGTGSKLFGGRWNKKGTAVLYTSENRSLAILETLVHMDPLTVPDFLKILTLEIPDTEIVTFAKSHYQKIIRSAASENAFKEAGENWISSKKSLCLKVPSVITPYEHNILINPVHPNFSLIQKVDIEAISLDERLLG